MALELFLFHFGTHSINMLTNLSHFSTFKIEEFAHLCTLILTPQVITIWFEVQRTWMHLESIFMSSEDIRQQLPNDSERFDSIDRDFKELMTEMAKVPNVIESTNRPGLLAVLEDLQKSLTLCEKALAVYLETKRLAFPRFYFVSSADLLDILSNGNQPELVAKHLTKLFDSIARLNFDRNDDGTINKKIFGMYAKDGEYVTFDSECDCNGPVSMDNTLFLTGLSK